MKNLTTLADQEQERIATEQEQQAQYNRAEFESDFTGMTDADDTAE